MSWEKARVFSAVLGQKQTGAVKERMEGREGEVTDGCHSSPKTLVKGRGTEQIDGQTGSKQVGGTRERQMRRIQKKRKDAI